MMSNDELYPIKVERSNRNESLSHVKQSLPSIQPSMPVYFYMFFFSDCILFLPMFVLGTYLALEKDHARVESEVIQNICIYIIGCQQRQLLLIIYFTPSIIDCSSPLTLTVFLIPLMTPVSRALTFRSSLISSACRIHMKMTYAGKPGKKDTAFFGWKSVHRRGINFKD